MFQKIYSVYFFCVAVCLLQQQIYAADETNQKPGSISVWVEPIQTSKSQKNGWSIFRVHPRVPENPQYSDFSTQPVVQGSVFVPFINFFQTQIFENFGFQFHTRDSFDYVREFLMQTSDPHHQITEIVIPHPKTLVEIVNGIPERQGRLTLSDGLVNALDYIEMIGSGSLPLALPEVNEDRLQYHNALHDLLNHSSLQIIMPKEWLQYIAARSRLFLEVRKDLLASIGENSDWLNLAESLTKNAAQSFDIDHGNFTNTFFSNPTTLRSGLLRFILGFPLESEPESAIWSTVEPAVFVSYVVYLARETVGEEKFRDLSDVAKVSFVVKVYAIAQLIISKTPQDLLLPKITIPLTSDEIQKQIATELWKISKHFQNHGKS